MLFPTALRLSGMTLLRNVRDLKILCLVQVLRKIGCRAFWNCGNIVGDISGISVQSIGDSAFRNCRYVKRFYFPNCKSISDYAFCSCFYTEVIEIGSINRIGYHTFSFCGNLEKFTVPESVQQICSGAFSWCTNLVIEVPERLGISGKIGEEAFHGCKKVIYTT
ncbi:MAG: leucine-rich repeat domain-containing protein [Ruminococcus flavefaciens]|nr:leucine-rich repeat domain-containing protein [Ruminococcus flavefaciens]MCM1230945.1 leucine-rich repeat domain-containing protein [Ruminococcus flavefaciens]